MSLSPLEFLQHILDELNYFGVDYELVWQIIETEVPSLHTKISRLLEDKEY